MPAGGSLPIERRRVGCTDCTISSLGLGTAALATPYGAPGAERGAPARRLAIATVRRALDAGVTFIDTAPAYGDAESIVGEACEGYDCQIATKIAIPAAGWESLSSSQVESHIRRSLERSLHQLRRNQVALLQVHNADEDLIARGEVAAVLEKLRHEGLASACGATVYGEQNALAAIRCETFDAVQVAYSALDRRAERQLVNAAAEAGTSLIARSILLRGVLSSAGRSLQGAFTPLALAADAFRIAAGASWEELPGAALAFALCRPWIASALIGPRDERELEALLELWQRFADRARKLEGEWDRGLTDELLNPARWPHAP